MTARRRPRQSIDAARRAERLAACVCRGAGCQVCNPTPAPMPGDPLAAGATSPWWVGT